MPEKDYYDCSPPEDVERVDLSDAPDEIDWEKGDLLQTWIDCNGDTEEFARRVKVAHDECQGRTVTYTGIDPAGGTRECPICMQMVEIDPEKNSVTHLD